MPCVSTRLTYVREVSIIKIKLLVSSSAKRKLPLACTQIHVDINTKYYFDNNISTSKYIYIDISVYINL